MQSSNQDKQAKVRIRSRVTRGTFASTEHHLTSTSNISWKCQSQNQCASLIHIIVSNLPKPHKNRLLDSITGSHDKVFVKIVNIIKL